MAFVAVTTPIVLPWPLQSSLEAMARVLLEPGDRSHIDFSRPVGEAALLSPESVSWRVFKNPLSLFIGGVTAVIMELAEPRVRTGIWEHTTFRLDPIRRLRRTGLAAMVTIYGARSTAEPMIGRIRRMHEMVAGTTASGEAYRANDTELLNWVHGTAAYGFLQAYHNCLKRGRWQTRDPASLEKPRFAPSRFTRCTSSASIRPSYAGNGGGRADRWCRP